MGNAAGDGGNGRGTSLATPRPMRTQLIRSSGSVCLVALLTSCAGEDTGSARDALTGAVFTTLVDGSAVDANIYDAKEDVYLDGGPPPGAPPGSAALPEGDYVFQVTNPGGSVLLSTDPIQCRSFHVDGDGLIDAVGTVPGGAACAHQTGVDLDHGSLTVQLYPYDDTPNPGGEYKVWVTAWDEYDPGSGKHGFIPRHSKTDNFKVDEEDRCERARCERRCGNGVIESDEECDDGNDVNGDGCSSLCRDERRYDWPRIDLPLLDEPS
jgi:cysteine-rich repeat protein